MLVEFSQWCVLTQCRHKETTTNSVVYDKGLGLTIFSLPDNIISLRFLIIECFMEWPTANQPNYLCFLKE